MDSKDIEQFILKFDVAALHKQRNKILNQPNLIGVGAGRCGTTSLYQYLAAHKDVYMSPVKEINYFGIRNTEKNKYGITFREYLYYFMGAESQKCIGEISPIYLGIPECASLINEKLGNIKILITIRDPIERMISHYKHHLDKHQINDLNEYCEKGLKILRDHEEKKYQLNWFHPVKNMTQSLYFEGVKRYIQQFGKENVLIITYDQLKKHSKVVLKEINQFLAIEDVEQELYKANSSPKDRDKDFQLNREVMKELLEKFNEDLAKLDELTGLKTTHWLEKY